MARIRTIKPEFWSSPDTASCEDPWARLLFVAMWNWADDCGRGTAIPKELAGFAFPNDEWISSADIRRMLGGIRRAFGVTFYVVAGRPYYAIPSWDDHQKIDRRSVGKHPGPEKGIDWDPDPTDPPDLHKQNGSSFSADPSGETHESTPSIRRDAGAGTGEQGNRGSTTSVTAAASTNTDDDFAIWWAAWPRKVARQPALKAYRAARRKKVTAELLLTAADEQITAWRSAGKEIEFIPHAATWLNAERYNEQVERPKFHVITNPESPWSGYRIDTSESPWSGDMGRTS